MRWTSKLSKSEKEEAGFRGVMPVPHVKAVLSGECLIHGREKGLNIPYREKKEKKG